MSLKKNIFKGATTLNKMTFSIATLRVMTLKITLIKATPSKRHSAFNVIMLIVIAE
jgi:hypothetical protein